LAQKYRQKAVKNLFQAAEAESKSNKTKLESSIFFFIIS